MKLQYRQIILVPVICMHVFLQNWIVIGAIMFFRDCKDKIPQQLNTLMWICLIINFWFLFWNNLKRTIMGAIDDLNTQKK